MAQDLLSSIMHHSANVETFPLGPLSQPPPIERTALAKRHISKGGYDQSSQILPDRPLGGPATPPEPPQALDTVSEHLHPLQLSRVRAVLIIVNLAGISFLNTMGSGVLISALPRVADDLGLAAGYLLWPASIYALAAGCLLLIFGAVADVVGAKLVWVTGSFLYVIFTVAVGLSRTGIQIILFRGFLGAAISMCLPAAVSVITNTFPRGTWRNIAFASNGMGQPLGYATGLVLGGVFTDTIGWRWSYYVSAMINFAISVSAIWVLPSVHHPSNEKPWTRRLIEDIDWVGATVLSVALGILLYVLATTTSSYHQLSEVQNIVLLVVSIILLMLFPVYMEYRVRHRKPALIPNKLWKTAAFTTICIAVFLCWASLNAIEYFATL